MNFTNVMNIRFTISQIIWRKRNFPKCNQKRLNVFSFLRRYILVVRNDRVRDKIGLRLKNTKGNIALNGSLVRVYTKSESLDMGYMQALFCQKSCTLLILLDTLPHSMLPIKFLGKMEGYFYKWSLERSSRHSFMEHAMQIWAWNASNKCS